jgi:aspartyl-tRNA synthetase
MFEKFPRISYKEQCLKYGSDKPDLRNPLIINDITEIFSREMMFHLKFLKNL